MSYRALLYLVGSLGPYCAGRDHLMTTIGLSRALISVYVLVPVFRGHTYHRSYKTQYKTVTTNTSHGHWYAGMQAKTLLACTEILIVANSVSKQPTLQNCMRCHLLCIKQLASAWYKSACWTVLKSLHCKEFRTVRQAELKLSDKNLINGMLDGWWTDIEPLCLVTGGSTCQW